MASHSHPCGSGDVMCLWGNGMSPSHPILSHRPLQASHVKPQDPLALWPAGRHRDADTASCETQLPCLQRDQACLPSGQMKPRRSSSSVGCGGWGSGCSSALVLGVGGSVGEPARLERTPVSISSAPVRGVTGQCGIGRAGHDTTWGLASTTGQASAPELIPEPRHW